MLPTLLVGTDLAAILIIVVEMAQVVRALRRDLVAGLQDRKEMVPLDRMARMLLVVQVVRESVVMAVVLRMPPMVGMVYNRGAAALVVGIPISLEAVVV